LYKKGHANHVEIFEGHHSSGFKTIHASFGANKIIVVELDAEVQVNLTLRTPFHNVVTTKSIPKDLGGDP
jgi:hypothetical protein